MKFFASTSWADVTRFQPARPRLSKSREANWRATRYGWWKLVDVVATNPTWLVTEEIADNRVIGSKPLTCAWRLIDARFSEPRIDELSARKRKSIIPRSAICAAVSKCLNST